MVLSLDELYVQMVPVAREKRIPFSACFELTARCNQQCKMCYLCVPPADKEIKARELTTAQWLRIAEEARDAGMFQVTLTGGEVFLRDDFKEIYEGIMNLGFIVQIYTNGTLITSDTVKWLKSMPPRIISITLYGASEESCASVTGYKYSYQKTVQAIDALMAAGLPVEIKTTLVKGTIHEHQQLLDFAEKRSNMLGVVNYVSPRREGDNTDPEGNRLTPEELVQFEVFLSKNAKVPPEMSNRIISDPDVLQLRIQQEVEKRTNMEDAFRCNAGKCSAWVTWDGRLLGCGLLSEPVAYPLQKGFAAAWAELVEACAKVPVCGECQLCVYRNHCEYCPARLLNEVGVFDKPAPYICETARRRYELATST